MIDYVDPPSFPYNDGKDKLNDMIAEVLLRHYFPQLSDDDWFTIGDMPNFRIYQLPTLVSWLRGFREGLSLEDSRSTYPEDFL